MKLNVNYDVKRYLQKDTYGFETFEGSKGM